MFSQRTHILCQFHLLVPKKAVEVVWLFQFPFHRGGEINTLKYSIAFRNKISTILSGTCKAYLHSKHLRGYTVKHGLRIKYDNSTL